MIKVQSNAIEKLRADIEAARLTAGRGGVASVVGCETQPIETLEAMAREHPQGTNVNGWRNPYPAKDPRSLLLEYQFANREDLSRFKLTLQSRQSGKDFTAQSEVAEDCYKVPKTEWMIAAPSERQALDSLDQGKTWAQGFGLAVEDYNEERAGEHAVLKAAEVIFSNGSRMRAVPGKPDTVRGRSASVLLTEFDFFEQPAETWRALLPSITNPLRGGQKKVRLITTPNGNGGAMHKLWTAGDGQRMKWSRHFVTIYHAVLMGLPVDIEELREAFGDPDGWAQEFCCQFLDAVSLLLPYDVIAACEGIEATERALPEYWTSVGGAPVDLGIDFGRRRDITVCWAAEKVADLQVTREVLCLEKMSTPDQVDALRPRIQKARRVALDYTGPGTGMGDYLVKEFGEWNPKENQFGKIELVTFTNAMKVDLFAKLRIAYEKRAWRIPSSVAIREDLHSIYRVVSPRGNVTFRAPHTEDGHADRATAQALCTHAGSYSSGGIISVAGIRFGANRTAARGLRPVFIPRRLA